MSREQSRATMNCKYCKKQMADARSEGGQGIMALKGSKFIGYACITPTCRMRGKIVLFSGELLHAKKEMPEAT